MRKHALAWVIKKQNKKTTYLFQNSLTFRKYCSFFITERLSTNCPISKKSAITKVRWIILLFSTRSCLFTFFLSEFLSDYVESIYGGFWCTHTHTHTHIQNRPRDQKILARLERISDVIENLSKFEKVLTSSKI